MNDTRRPHNATAVLAHVETASAVLAGADSADSDMPLYMAMQTAIETLVGYRLFTVLRITPDGEGLQRMHSSNLEVYPAGGVKRIGDDTWLRSMTTMTGPQVSPDADAIRRNFFDHEAIFALGCRSAINVPIRYRGRNLGTLNLLHRDGWYRQDDGAVSQLFANLIGAAWAAPHTFSSSL